METKVQLTDDQINYLSELPEQGMGYQIVDIILKNGTVLKKRTVLNSTFLVLNETEKLNPQDIDKLNLSQ
jgi:hypothetical protein